MTHLIWLLFSVISGILEAQCFQKPSYLNSKKAKRIHIWLTIFRTTVFAALFAGILIYPQISATTVSLFAINALWCALVFPYFHDGSYYVTRRWLSNGNLYRMGWKAYSTTTTAVFSFRYRTRCFLLGCAIVLYLTFGLWG